MWVSGDGFRISSENAVVYPGNAAVVLVFSFGSRSVPVTCDREARLRWLLRASACAEATADKSADKYMPGGEGVARQD